MSIYANAITQIAIKRDFYYAFDEKKDAGLPEMVLHTIDKDIFQIGDISFLPIHVMHREMPVLGFRMGDLTYITDANFISEQEKEKIKGSQILILNALRQQDHPTHFNLAQAVELATELQVPKVYFIHFSHQIGLHHQVEAGLPKGMYLAYDGLELNCLT
jgi:phosphoribosyl 1,2-cyclic phosphate phosphodiesterase